jgi:glycosyltransferase involved in cell wall biosynthesis
MDMKLDLTIAIPVLNEEKNLPGCLEAIGENFARKIVIIDSGSTDQTKEIARQFDAEVLNFVWDGKFPKKRNWFLQNHTPSTKWVLFLDADEFVTEKFKKDLRKALDSDDKAGYWLSYTVYFLGKKLRGGYPLRKLALFRVGAGEYERIEEDKWSHLDMEIHEHPSLQGKTGVIRSKIDHRDLNGISRYVAKHNEYAGWEAARFIKVSADPKHIAGWTWKQRVKYRLMRTSLIGPFYFLGSFILMGGFIDGVRGFSFAMFKMSYFTQIYCRIKENKSLIKE